MTAWTQQQSLRTRLTSLVAAAVGVAVVLAATASYLLVDHQLHTQVDKTLTGYVQRFSQPNDQYNPVQAAKIVADTGDLVQAVQANGSVVSVPGVYQTRTIPVTRAEVGVADGPGQQLLFTNQTIGGVPYRVMTVGGLIDVNGQPGALQIAASLANVDRTMSEIGFILLLVVLGGIAIAVGLGLLVARATIRPVKRLTAAAEHVAATQNLDAVIDEDGDDELARLAHAFNDMLRALRSSRQQQAQLVSDAGHELRTPLTSLRTNIEFLMRATDIPAQDRSELLDDIRGQLEELTTLVGDVVDSARQDELQHAEPTEVRLDHIVAKAVERVRRRAPSLTYDVALTAGAVRAQPAMLERAVLNVLDNAAKWSPPLGTVTVRLERKERWQLDIRDRGVGIAPADLPRVFDRFYRASAARSMPGSGLGLAIVSQVVAAHGGTVEASSPPDGGTLVHVELPTVAEDEPAPPQPAGQEGDKGKGAAPPPFAPAER